jgi:hypothetical protein
LDAAQLAAQIADLYLKVLNLTAQKLDLDPGSAVDRGAVKGLLPQEFGQKQPDHRGQNDGYRQNDGRNNAHEHL